MHPADILIDNWGLGGKSAALDVSVTSLLKSEIVLEASITAGAANIATENRKLLSNGPTCEALGWECVPIVVDSFCASGETEQPKPFLDWILGWLHKLDHARPQFCPTYMQVELLFAPMLEQPCCLHI